MIDAFFRAIERSGFGHRRSRRWLLKWGATLGGLTAISNRFGLPSRAPAAILNDHDRAQIKMKTQTHIAVIGAGAFGGWTALYLLRRGARVTLIDSWGPGNSRASSGGETRVIRGTYGPNQPYTEMAARAIQLWREHEQRWGRQLMFPIGVLWMAADADDTFERGSLPLLRKAGIPYEELSQRDLARRWPQISLEGVRWGVYEPESGFLTARIACQAVLEAFRSEGGEYRQAAVQPEHVEEAKWDGLSLSDASKLTADQYVFACGPWLGNFFRRPSEGASAPPGRKYFSLAHPREMIVTLNASFRFGLIIVSVSSTAFQEIRGAASKLPMIRVEPNSIRLRATEP